MGQDMLAPPKLKPRTFAIMVGVMSALPAAGGVVFTASGHWTLGQLAWRLGLLLMLDVLALIGYIRLLKFSQGVRPERMPYIHAAVGSASFLVLILAMEVMLRGSQFAASMSYAYMLPLVIGGTLIQGGWGRRVGESMHCPSCEYEFAFKDEDAPIRCPECATPWLGRLKKGRRVKSVRMMGAGAAFAVIGTMVMMPIFWLAPLAKILPTPVLFATLYVQPKTHGAGWSELAKRPLGAWWVEVMAHRLIAARGNDHWDSGGDWFETVTKAGKMPAPLVEKYHREAFLADLVAPARVRSGEEFTASFRIKRAARSGNSALGIMFAGYSVDGAAPVGRVKEATWSYQLRPGVFEGARTAFEHKLKLTTPGEHRVSATYWVISQPSFWPITWGGNNQPVKPATATWFERVEVERTITVK